MIRAHRLGLGILFALSWATPAIADSGVYSNGAGYAITVPYDPDSFTTVFAAFPAGISNIVDGYPLASRPVAATGRTLYLLQTFGGDDWIPVAILDQSVNKMDPAFVEISTDGSQIAIGAGFGQPLYVFPTKLLSVSNPVVLNSNTLVIRLDNLNYYSAAFRDGHWLFIDEGNDTPGSDVFAIDTLASPITPVPILNGVAGASGGIAFDAGGNLVTGIGLDFNSTPTQSRTGELKLFPAAKIDAVLNGGTPLSYDPAVGSTSTPDGLLLATGMLSADFLGFDAKGNLFVGGGDAFGTSGHLGYANLIDSSVITRVLGGGTSVDVSDTALVATIAPDPCRNDDSTSVVYSPGVDMLLVTASLESAPPNCAPTDFTMGPGGPITLYFPPDAPDSDGDGIPDGADPDFEARQHPLGLDDLSRLVNAIDSTASDLNFDTAVDYDHDSQIGDADFAFLQANWGRLPAQN
jgi:hypothetical protein